MKRFLAGMLAIAIMITSTVPAFAIDTEIDDAKTEASQLIEKVTDNNKIPTVPVELTAEATLFSVTVPTGLPVWVDGKGEVTTATDVQILNNSYGPIKVESVSVEPRNEWTLVDFTKDFSKDKVGLKEFSFHLQGANVKTDGSCAVEGFNAINGHSSTTLTYGANISTQKASLINSNIANVVFTIGWDDLIYETHIKPDTLDIKKDTQHKIELDREGPVLWSSQDSSVAEVKQDGVVLAINVGTTKITATSDDYSYVCEVTVSRTPIGVRINTTNALLNKGGTFQLVATALYKNKIAWTSSDENIATVNDRGLVTGVSDGVATITASIDNYDANCFITIDTKYNDFIVTGSNRGKVGFKGVRGEELIIPETFQDTDGTWYRVTEIGRSAFRNCNLLKSVVIPKGVKAIRDEAFFYCSALTSVTLPEGLTTIGSYGLANCGFSSIDLPDSLTHTGSYSFSGNWSLRSVTIPKSMTNLSYGMFLGNKVLRTVNIHDGVTSISEEAFLSCTNLYSLFIPNSVSFIGKGAFYKCPGPLNIDKPANSIKGAPWGAPGPRVNWLR